MLTSSIVSEIPCTPRVRPVNAATYDARTKLAHAPSPFLSAVWMDGESSSTSAEKRVLTGRRSSRKLFLSREAARDPRTSMPGMFAVLRASLCLALLSTPLARAEPPTLTLGTNAQLTIRELPADAPATIELTSDDALPITWTRGNARQASLPLVLMPGAVDPVVMTLLKQPRSIVAGEVKVPSVQIDVRAYERLASWRPTASPTDRRTTLLLAIAFATMLLLVTLLRKGAAIGALAVCVLFSVALALAANRRPTLLVRDEADGSTWYLATEAQTLRVPINDRMPWLPVVESTQHLKTLSLRIETGVDSSLILSLPADGKVCLRLDPTKS